VGVRKKARFEKEAFFDIEDCHEIATGVLRLQLWLPVPPFHPLCRTRNSRPAGSSLLRPRSRRIVSRERRRRAHARARFRVGDRVIARNLNPAGHTRLARYVRARRGVIRHDWGVYVFPDSNAHGGASTGALLMFNNDSAETEWWKD
jgi:hypothetical protein